MAERWLNAVVTCIVPLSCPIDATEEQKLAAVEPLLDRLIECDRDMVLDFHTEFVEEGEPISSAADSEQEERQMALQGHMPVRDRQLRPSAVIPRLLAGFLQGAAGFRHGTGSEGTALESRSERGSARRSVASRSQVACCAGRQQGDGR